MARSEITLQSQLGDGGRGGFPEEVTQWRFEVQEGPCWGEGGGEKSKCKGPGTGTNWTCWKNGPEVEVAGAGEPGEMEGDTGRSQGPGLGRGCCREECGFCSEVHKP